MHPHRGLKAPHAERFRHCSAIVLASAFRFFCRHGLWQARVGSWNPLGAPLQGVALLKLDAHAIENARMFRLYLDGVLVEFFRK